ncbi:MAG TPA: RNA 2',3'-cyclic phosphodiesterase [Verrucomicrobiae bacterium]
MSDCLRLFIAIALPEEVRQRVAAFQREWQTGARGDFIRWTPVEQIHLTLRFLGDIPAVAVQEVETALRRACHGVKGFDLTVDGCGGFPDARQPRVLWVGVGGAIETVVQLQERVADETKEWGEIEPRPFRAHLTLGRVKAAPPAVLREISRRLTTQPCGRLGSWRVSEVRLMRSELSPTGARHTELCGVALGG